MCKDEWKSYLSNPFHTHAKCFWCMGIWPREFVCYCMQKFVYFSANVQNFECSHTCEMCSMCMQVLLRDLFLQFTQTHFCTDFHIFLQTTPSGRTCMHILHICGHAKFHTFTLLHTFPQFFANKLHQAIILKQFFNLDWNSKHSVLQGSRAWLSMCSCNLQIPILLVTCACVRCISMLAKCVPTTFFIFASLCAMKRMSFCYIFNFLHQGNIGIPENRLFLVNDNQNFSKNVFDCLLIINEYPNLDHSI